MEDAKSKDPRVEIDENVPLRLEALHVYGTEGMSTTDVFRFFYSCDPVCIEWINASSCNIIFRDKDSCARALELLSDFPADETSLPVSQWRTTKRHQETELWIRMASVKDKKDEQKQKRYVRPSSFMIDNPPKRPRFNRTVFIDKSEQNTPQNDTIGSDLLVESHYLKENEEFENKDNHHPNIPIPKAKFNGMWGMKLRSDDMMEGRSIILQRLVKAERRKKVVEEVQKVVEEVQIQNIRLQSNLVEELKMEQIEEVKMEHIVKEVKMEPESESEDMEKPHASPIVIQEENEDDEEIIIDIEEN